MVCRRREAQTDVQLTGAELTGANPGEISNWRQIFQGGGVKSGHSGKCSMPRFRAIRRA